MCVSSTINFKLYRIAQTINECCLVIHFGHLLQSQECSSCLECYDLYFIQVCFSQRLLPRERRYSTLEKITWNKISCCTLSLSTRQAFYHYIDHR